MIGYKTENLKISAKENQNISIQMLDLSQLIGLYPVSIQPISWVSGIMIT